jgi:drug/metabolite transporter (DMT)-like permease
VCLTAIERRGRRPLRSGLGGPAEDPEAPLVAGRKLSAADDFSVTGASLGLASAVYAVPAALTVPQTAPPPRVLGALAALAVICTALAFLL